MSCWGNDDDAGGGEKKKGCFKCGEEGHMSRDCPTGGGGGGDGGACRKCGEEGHFAKDCSLPDKCFKCKKEGHMSVDCELPDTCFKCKKEGHMAADCELPDTCRKCKKEGHMAKDCELPDVCRNCGEEGHMSKDCSKPQLCKRCGEEGHMVRECTQEEKTRQMTDEEGKFDSIPVKVTRENPPSAIKSFSSAGLRPLLLENIEKSGYKVPTPVQKICLPIVMSGRDLMSCAQTGSGKTAGRGIAKPENTDASGSANYGVSVEEFEDAHEKKDEKKAMYERAMYDQAGVLRIMKRVWGGGGRNGGRIGGK